MENCIILRLPQVLEKVGLRRSSIYAYAAKHEFPAPVKIGARAVGWLSTDIDRWIEARADLARLSGRTAAES